MDILTLLYGMTGFLCAMAFVPQISALITDRSGAKSLSLTSWTMFTACSAISLLYSMQHNGDACFIFCSACGTLGNITVLSLALLRRWQAAESHLGLLAAVRIAVRPRRAH